MSGWVNLAETPYFTKVVKDGVTVPEQTGSGDLGPVSWRPTTVKWRQFSQSNRHFTIGTRQTECHEALPSSANVQSHLTSSLADDGNASWYRPQTLTCTWTAIMMTRIVRQCWKMEQSGNRSHTVHCLCNTGCPTTEQLLQFCCFYELSRYEIWRDNTPVPHSFYGSLENLLHTATYIAKTGWSFHLRNGKKINPQPPVQAYGQSKVETVSSRFLFGSIYFTYQSCRCWESAPSPSLSFLLLQLLF